MPKLFKFLQEKVVFLPSALHPDFRFKFPYPYEELLWETPFGGKINALHFKVENPLGVILYFHGNSGNLTRWGEIAGALTTYGYDVLVHDYRGFGKSSGLRNEENLFSDAQYAYNFLAERYGEEKITVFGRSLGGAFALKMAAKNSPARVIVEAAFYNLQDMAARWLPFSATEKIAPVMTYHFRSDRYIEKVNCPVYHFHGTADLVVPYRSGRKLFNQLEKLQPALEKEFITIKAGGHNDLATHPTYAKNLHRILTATAKIATDD